MTDSIKVHFEQFGQINSVKIDQQTNSDTFFALVEFKLTETAAAVLSLNETHRVDDCDVKVKAAELWQQPDHILNALYDDCLRVILFILTEPDLTNAANVCVRFNELAKTVFSDKFKQLNLNECSHEEAKNSLMTFGSLAESIDYKSKYATVPEGGYDGEILNMIAQYCNLVLKKLTINAFNFNGELPNDVTFDVALSKLEILSLNNCHLQKSLKKLVSACGELKVLYIHGCLQRAADESDQCFPQFNEFNQLEELYLSNAYRLTNQFLCRIIASNSTIKKLSIVGQLDYLLPSNPSKIFDIIAQKLPHLLEFDFRIKPLKPRFTEGFSELMRCLGCLKSLKVLKLDLIPYGLYYGCSVKKLSSILIENDGITLEHLELINARIDTKAVEDIEIMKQLKVLSLFEIIGLTDEHLIQLAKGLGSTLEALHLHGSTTYNLTTNGLKNMLPLAKKLSLLTLKPTTMTIDVDDYKTMLATVQERPENNGLLIELTGKGDCQVKVDEIVLLEHRDVLYIDEKKN